MLLGAIKVYQRFASQLRSGSCPMRPSCSAYAYEAFSKYPPLVAYAMTADRLHRCSHDLGRYALDPDDPYLRLDPVPVPSRSGRKPAQSPNIELREKAALQQTPRIVPPEDISTEQRLLRFANELRSRGSFADASIEYRRFLSFYPSSQDRSEAGLALFGTYRQAGQLMEAVHWGEDMIRQLPLVAGDLAELKLTIGYDLMMVGNGARGRAMFDDVAVTGDSGSQRKAKLLSGLSFARDGEWSEAQAVFGSDFSAFGQETMNRARRLSQLASDGARLPRKHPALAGVLGVVPGLGYLYDGYPQTAVASAVVNGLFMAGTYKAFKGNNKPLGAVLGLFSVGWYVGNIRGSVTTAQRRNLSTRADHVTKFEIGFRF